MTGGPGRTPPGSSSAGEQSSLALGDEQTLADLERNDTGNGDRLRLRRGEDLLYVVGSRWRAWDGSRWRRDDESGLATQIAQETARAIMGEADAIARRWSGIEAERWPDGPPPHPGVAPRDDAADDRKAAWRERSERWREWAKARDDHGKVVEAHRKFSIASGNHPRIKAMLEMAKAHRLIEANAMDPHPLLFNCLDGTLDLAGLRPVPEGVERRPFAPRSFARRDRISRMAEVRFDAEAECPKWRAFLERIIVDPDQRPLPDVIAWLQRFVGYCLTGSVAEQIMVIAWGAGANGKTVLFTVLRRILGNYALTIDPRTLTEQGQRSASAASPDLARLAGVRLVIANESKADDWLNEGAVKTMTGGDQIVAREMYGDVIAFDPQFTPVLLTNHKPKIRGQDEGIWRRVILFPFLAVLPKDQRREFDELVEDLCSESAGILKWALDGLRLYFDVDAEGRRIGLTRPPALQDASDEYRRASDPVGQFIEACSKEHPNWEEFASEWFALYQKWCEANGERVWSQKKFGERLGAWPGVVRHVSGVTIYIGRKLGDPAELGLDKPSRAHGGRGGDHPPKGKGDDEGFEPE